MERNSAVNRAILGRNIRLYQRNYHITDTLVLRDPRNVDPILEPLKKQRCTSAYDWTAYPEYRVLACLAQPAAEYSACWRGIRFQCQGNLQFPCECAMCSFHFNGLRLGLLCLYTFSSSIKSSICILKIHHIYLYYTPNHQNINLNFDDLFDDFR